MSQYTINIGALPNDGTGDPLRTAFNETNLNFNQIFTAGPVLSNIQIANNTILTTNTNGNLVLAPNGIGVVQSNVSIVPNTSNIRNLGSNAQRWSSLYIQYANISGNLDLAGTFSVADLTVSGNLTVTGNTIQIGNLITDAKTIQLANTAASANAANGSGMTVGANDNIATMLYSSGSNSWVMNIGIDTPNIVVNNISSDDSTFVTIRDGLDVQGDITAETLSVSGNVTADYFLGNTQGLTGNITNLDSLNFAVENISALVGNNGVNIGAGGFNNLVVLPTEVLIQNVPLLTQGNITANGNITADYFIGNGSQLTNLPIATSIANGTSTISIPSANGNIYVGVGNVGSTEFTQLGINTINLSALGNITADGTIQGNVVTADSAINTAGTIAATGNISAGNIDTTGTVTATQVTADYGNVGGMNMSFGDIWLSDNSLTQLNVSPNGEGWAYLQLPTDATANTANTRLHNDAGNIELGTGDFSTGSNSYNWYFKNDGTLTAPGNISTSGNLVATDNVSASNGTFTTAVTARNINADGGNISLNPDFGLIFTQSNAVITANTVSWTFGEDGNLTLPGGNSVIYQNGNNFVIESSNNNVQLTANSNVQINSGYNSFDSVYQGQWSFDSDGRLLNTPVFLENTYNPGYLQFVANSSGGNNGYTTLRLVPDETVASNGEFLILDPTSQGNIHLRAGDTLDNSSANLFLGGDNSYFMVERGLNPNVYVRSNSNTWTFDTTGNLTLPADGFLQVTSGIVGTGASPAPTLSGFGSADIIGNISGGNLISNNGLYANVDLIVGDRANASASKGRFVSNSGFMYLQVGNGTAGSTGNIVFSPYQSSTARVTVDTASGNITAVGNVSGGNIITAGNISGNTAGYAIGYRDIPQVSFTGNATISTVDAGKHFYSTQSTGYTLTIANNASQGFQVGAAITIVNQGSGTITVAEGSGVTLYLAGNVTAGNRTVATFGMATLIKVATDTWFINGTGVS